MRSLARSTPAVGKALHAEAQMRTREYLKQQAIVDHMFYAPAHERYWSEPVRLVAVNMETYGYTGCGHYQVDRDTLRDWIYDHGDDGTRTARYTYAFLAVVLAYLEQGIKPSAESFEKAYRDEQRLEEMLDRSAYYNLRAESNCAKPQDFAAISAVGTTTLGKLVWDEILALEPDVMFISGVAGLNSVNCLLPSGHSLGFREFIRHPDGFLLQSMSHPSRPHYAQWQKMAEQIGTMVQAQAG